MGSSLRFRREGKRWGLRSGSVLGHGFAIQVEFKPGPGGHGRLLNRRVGGEGAGKVLSPLEG